VAVAVALAIGGPLIGATPAQRTTAAILELDNALHDRVRLPGGNDVFPNDSVPLLLTATRAIESVAATNPEEAARALPEMIAVAAFAVPRLDLGPEAAKCLAAVSNRPEGFNGTMAFANASDDRRLRDLCIHFLFLRRSDLGRMADRLDFRSLGELYCRDIQNATFDPAARSWRGADPELGSLVFLQPAIASLRPYKIKALLTTPDGMFLEGSLDETSVDELRGLVRGDEIKEQVMRRLQQVVVSTRNAHRVHEWTPPVVSQFRLTAYLTGLLIGFVDESGKLEGPDPWAEVATFGERERTQLRTQLSVALGMQFVLASKAITPIPDDWVATFGIDENIGAQTRMIFAFCTRYPEIGKQFVAEDMPAFEWQFAGDYDYLAAIRSLE
jgi:hypothetical protein